MRQDIEWYIRLAELGMFRRSDLRDILYEKAEDIFRYFSNMDYIDHVNDDWYVLLDIDTRYPLIDHYWIVPKMFPDACVCLHTAFELYGAYNQVYFTVYVNSPKPFDYFEYYRVGYTYIPITTPRKIVYVNDIPHTCIEQTIVDSIAGLEKYCDLEELIQSISLLPSFSEAKILEECNIRNDSFVWQKVGYIFEYFAEQYSLSNDFFEACKANITTEFPDKRLDQCSMYNLVYHQTWKLYAPETLDVFLYEPFFDADV